MMKKEPLFELSLTVMVGLHRRRRMMVLRLTLKSTQPLEILQKVMKSAFQLPMLSETP